MAIIVPSRRVWTRQPTGPVGVDWSNPITRGLIGAYGASQSGGLINLVGRKTSLAAGGSGSLFVPADRGYALRVNGSGTYESISYYEDRNFSLGGSSGRTFACWIRVNALPAIEGNLFAWTQSGATSSISQLGITSSGAVRTEVYRGGSFGPAVTSQTVTLGRWHFVAGVMENGDISRKSYLDANSATTTAGGGAGWASDTWLTISAAPWSTYGLGVNADILFPLVWERPLTDAEVHALRANYWQLFAPQSSPIFYSLPAATGGAPVLSLPGVQSITATSAVPKVTVTFS